MRLPQLIASRRSRILIPLSIFVIFGIAFNYYYTSNFVPGLPQLKSLPLWPSNRSKFWPSFASLLANNHPRCSPPARPARNAAAKSRFYDDQWKLRSDQSWVIEEAPFENLLTIKDEDVQSMHESHSSFVDLLDTTPLALEYKSGTKGIVTSAGGSYFPVLIISLLMLRRTGSTLPVEVFLTTREEYESQVCEVVLPWLNAKCIILSDILPFTFHSFTIRSYQLKIFAILFSSFESLLFLDADNFPIHQPEELFSAEPFTTHNLVLWPDFWTPTPSPYFSTITGLDPDIIRTRPTIEAGQILVSKRHHTKTLLLAAYYNVYSEYFYPLITQGGPGEGDKDLFAPAALILNTTFYTIESPPENLGIRYTGGVAVIQYDPTPPSPSSCSSPPCQPRAFFIHASWQPKLNALHKIESTRKWGSEEHSREVFGMDVEKVTWGYMVEVACNTDWEFRDWGKGNKSETVVCEQSQRCYRNVFGHEYDGSERLGFWGDGGLV